MSHYCEQCLLTMKTVLPSDVGIFIKIVFKIQDYGYGRLDSIQIWLMCVFIFIIEGAL
jgi:hypothetical protein